MQTRSHSLIESIGNTALGAVVSFTGQLVIFPAVGLTVTITQNVWILAAFTVLSIARNYGVRRVGNWVTVWRHNRAINHIKGNT